MLITSVSLYDKVIKTEDCIVSAQPCLEDFLPRNRWWVKKTVLPGRLEASREKMCRPMFGHLAKQALPRRFYVQLGREDKHMTVIPLEFMRSLNTHLPRSVPLATCQWCNWWVQFQEIDKEIVIFLGWKSLLWKHELKVNDILVFKLQHCGFKVKIFSAAFSTQVSCLCSRD